MACAGFVHVKKFCMGRSHGIRKSGTDMIEQEQRRYEMENWVQFYNLNGSSLNEGRENVLEIKIKTL